MICASAAQLLGGVGGGVGVGVGVEPLPAGGVGETVAGGVTPGGVAPGIPGAVPRPPTGVPLPKVQSATLDPPGVPSEDPKNPVDSATGFPLVLASPA